MQLIRVLETAAPETPSGSHRQGMNTTRSRIATSAP